MVVLPVRKQGRIPVQVERVEVLDHVLKGDPEHARNLVGSLDGRGGGNAFPNDAITPRILDKEKTVAEFLLEFHNSVVVLAHQT
jgi:hypothetical protein